MAAARAHRVRRYRRSLKCWPDGRVQRPSCAHWPPGDVVTRIGDAYWLRVPVGKLRNDPLIPRHDLIVALLADWTAINAEHIRRHGRLLADGHAPIDRRTVHRIVATVGRNAGIGPVDPHQLRHTLATQ